MNVNELTAAFRQKFNTAPLLVRSPGRINIIGEHTDYNDGFVLPAAIDKAAYLAIALREDDQVNLVAHNLNESFSVSIQDIKPMGDHHWSGYILGVAAQFLKKNMALKGFDAILHSDVPMGAGLSSSAAVECATAFALNHLLGAGLERMELVKMAQQAEHEYAGVMCGIMDQFASMMGKKDQLMQLDCRSLQYAYVPLNLQGYKILLFNTNVKHALASSAYNTRRQQCMQAVEWISAHETGVQSLRDATEWMLDKYVAPKDELVCRRSRFVVQENERLLLACRDLQNGDIHALGKKMFATHEGLSKQYEVSCPELDFLVDFVKNNAAVPGARMMGGGFGGCTINLVKADAADELVAAIQPAYKNKMRLPLTVYTASTADGTAIINTPTITS